MQAIASAVGFAPKMLDRFRVWELLAAVSRVLVARKLRRRLDLANGAR